MNPVIVTEFKPRKRRTRRPELDRNSHEWHEYLRELFRTHLIHLDGHWKGAVEAVVPADMADDMIEAMNFMGSLVDGEFPEGSNVRLYSDGYWAHGF